MGKSIRIFLVDGSVTGLKFGEVVNHTIQAISCPRNRFAELSDYSEAKRPGVYFLFGLDEETGDPKVYIGEAENVLDRLQNHILLKDFWSEVILFISKDENLTKSHVKYLESRIIQISFEINRYKVENYNQPQLSSLPRPDRDAMEEFLVYIKLLLGVLGHKLLEELISPPNKTSSEQLVGNQTTQNIAVNVNDLELSLNVGTVKAKAYMTDEGIVVLKGSAAVKDLQSSLTGGYVTIRERLVSKGIIQMDDNKYIFQENYLFPSPSQAASIIVGYSINGREHWRNNQGVSLKEIENRASNKS